MGAFRAAAVLLVLIGSAGQSGPDPGALLKEADRLAWLRAWSAAEPHFLQAQKLFAASGDERNALYAEVSAFRGALPRMAVPEASSRLADYLEHPLVQADERIRLRVLIIKGETDQTSIRRLLSNRGGRRRHSRSRSVTPRGPTALVVNSVSRVPPRRRRRRRGTWPRSKSRSRTVTCPPWCAG